ncbi:MAG: S-methyl-5'-thioadenosine phosphorylase [Halobacteria archaeon]
MKAEIGIIGGSGLYRAEIIKEVKKVEIDTPFGKPSDVITLGVIGGREVAFLPRHGAGHRFSPSELNARANIFAFKKLGVNRIISVSAVGSLKEEIKPLDIVFPDQIFDRTKSRPSTFFSNGIVAHVSFADPFCPELSKLLSEIAIKKKFRAHSKGTYVCIEGPQFSTRAESRVYRQLGFDIVGMTALPEAKLAREAEICYTIIATVTDYDVWYEQEVNVEIILENMKKNEQSVLEILKAAIPAIPKESKCNCQRALAGAIVTAPEKITRNHKVMLEPLLKKYIK